MTNLPKLPPHLIFDWGNTLMADLPGQSGPMHLWPDLQVMPAVLDVIPRLAASHTLSIATNAESSDAAEVRKALDRVNLGTHFSHIFTSRDLGCTKQELPFWPEVIKRLGITPADACMIGDNLEADVLPALRAGLAAIWYLPVNNESVTMPHFMSIRTLRELLSQFS